MTSTGRAGSIYKRCSAKGCGRTLRGDARVCACGSRRYRWRWELDVSAPGEPRRKRRGAADTKAEAEQAMAELKGEVAGGQLVEPSKHLVGDYLESWLAGAKGEIKPSTYESYRLSITQRIAPRDGATWLPAPYLGGLRLQALSRSHVKALYAHLRAEGRADGRGGLAAKTVHNVHLCLHRALADAVDDRLIKANPAASPSRSRRGRSLAPTPSRPNPEAWTGEELATFLDAARAHRLHPLLHLAAHTGMRRGELCGLTWRHLGLDAGTVTVARERIKGEDGAVEEAEFAKSDHSRRTVDLDAGTVAVLRDHRARHLEERAALGQGKPSLDAHVFTGASGQPLHPDTASQAFERVLDGLHARADRLAAEGRAEEAAGYRLRRLSLHGLRDTHATLSLAAGVPLHVVSRRLGHADEAFTARVYAAVLPRQDAAAAAAFAQLVSPAAGR